jgi:hypothetical protein
MLRPRPARPARAGRRAAALDTREDGPGSDKGLEGTGMVTRLLIEATPTTTRPGCSEEGRGNRKLGSQKPE